MDWGLEDDYEAATYNRRQALSEPKSEIYKIPGEEPPTEVDYLVSTNGEWTLSRDGTDWALEHSEHGMIDAGPVSWEDLKYAYYGEMRYVPSRQRTLMERTEALLWKPEDGPPPKRVGAIQLLEQDVWWITKDKRAVRIEEMSESHVNNLYAFLLRRADMLKQRYEFNLIRGPQPSGDAACDAFDTGMSELFEQSASEWLLEQPLMKKLGQLVGV
jgi:hypothetical protein